MTNRSIILQLIVLITAIFLTTTAWAKGMKGNMEEDEINFVENTFIPILIKSNLCVKATGDCRGGHVYCMSFDSLGCDVYGIADIKSSQRNLLSDA